MGKSSFTMNSTLSRYLFRFIMPKSSTLKVAAKVSVILFLVSLIFSSCSVFKRTNVQGPHDVKDLVSYCDSSKAYKSLSISKIRANVFLDEENYDARLSLYYIPDSIIFFTAVNSGFEIIRGAIYKDSTVIINRLEKFVYIQKYNGLGYTPLVAFADLEVLFNRSILCNNMDYLSKDDQYIIADFSSQDIKKRITFSSRNLALNKFEFFQKKNGDYIVGNINEQGMVSILSNYIIDDLELTAQDGVFEFDKELSINLSVNRVKYTYFYL